MHITRKNIIAKLMYAEELRYTDIKPKEMAGNQFAYHLDALIHDNLVVKLDDGSYTLTLKGKQYTDKASQKTLEQTAQPKIVVSVVVRNESDQILLHKRGRQPFSGLWGIPSAKSRYSEHPVETVDRVVSRRLSFAEYSAEYVSTMSIRMPEDSDTAAHLIALVYSCSVNSSDYLFISDRYVFVNEDDLDKYRLFPGTEQMVGSLSPVEELDITV